MSRRTESLTRDFDELFSNNSIYRNKNSIKRNNNSIKCDNYFDKTK